MNKFISLLPTGAAFFFALLFVYASVSKLSDFENFQVQLAQSPLLSAYAGFVSYAVILTELAVAGLLLFPRSRLAGLYASFGLMVAFTVYIYLILNYSDFVPCSCGGILEQMGWTEHLVFNIACVALALAAVALMQKRRKRSLIISGLVAVVAGGLVTGLFLSSEYIIRKENNFTRRFIPHAVTEDKALDLGVDSYYFASVAGGRVYLGNYTAPWLLTTVDSSLSAKTEIHIVPDRTDPVYRSLQFAVLAPYFYLYDGTVPVIYRGRLGQRQAKTVSYRDVYFTRLAVLDSATFGFRAQDSRDGSHVLGTLRLNGRPKVRLNSGLLTALDEGVFSTDGELFAEQQQGHLGYIYSYRNRFYLYRPDFTDVGEFKTIDTVSGHRLKVAALPDGTRKMGTPPVTVDKEAVLHGRVLFNRSGSHG